jgi:hypothetical protein
VVLSLLVTAVFPIAAEKISAKPNVTALAKFMFFGFFTFIWIWLVFGELRTKLVKVGIQDDKVTVTNFLCLGFKKVYTFSKFEGFETSLLPSNYGNYEHLYLIDNGRKKVKLSQFYHGNYLDLKNLLTSKLRNLGHRSFSYIQEVKEIFT